MHTQKFTILYSNDMHIHLAEPFVGEPSKTVATSTTAVLGEYLQVHLNFSRHLEG